MIYTVPYKATIQKKKGMTHVQIVDISIAT